MRKRRNCTPAGVPHSLLTLILALLVMVDSAWGKPFDQPFIDRVSLNRSIDKVLSSLKLTDDGGSPLYYLYQAIAKSDG